jgi:hypothetical protein
MPYRAAAKAALIRIKVLLRMEIGQELKRVFSAIYTIWLSQTPLRRCKERQDY